ncbi:PH domain containing protein [Acanthamoeba castellanii str. Neff]|uniref:PH domain containing protein n=1 Tax=Acanthamoeba castellanii (strain ATCC 30010 / Neff) TaxID=1257118 RepID=L8HJA0_ACACF|nr:PH domain containing protein [Acanthamoeba castellanii str. Neff]ELR24481.1 PH domain containing protein [Acanthamoeba castellanii str. Neff]
MDDEAGSSTARHSTTTAPGGDVGSVGQQLSKEGWLIKLSGYLVKRRYFRLRRNRLAYYRSPQDDVPRRIIELDGCVVEPAEDGFVSLFERRIGRAQPHRYVILSHDPEVMAEWIEAIKRASTLYEEIFYAAIVRESEGASPFEHCFPHWSDQHKVFRNLVKEALHRRKERGWKQGREVYENHKLYKVCSLVTDSATPAFVCVVEKRLASYKPEAFLEDLRQRFQEEGTVQQPIGEATLGQMMRVYSPGYEDAKDAPDLVANATKWLRRLWEVNGAK